MQTENVTNVKSHKVLLYLSSLILNMRQIAQMEKIELGI